ncbi:hypothetical protein [Flavobacterium aquidurense]|uniref:hypothetical protein n=1 Tax=Flavobacterium aquidurense TaxID=362413 RepID=UPI00285B4524|nr:hypothetical protein [Flavobacterium aquidurense]MDR7371036.1 hypothetical protein [Flavobacterium aquidurense]
MTIYNINGIPEEVELKNITAKEGFYVVQEQLDNFIYRGGEKVSEIESMCFELRTLLAIKIFGSAQEYYRIVEHPIYYFVAQAGIDADVRISKKEFEEFVLQYPDKETLYKMLYFFDIDNVIGTLQNCMVETKFAVGEFYKQLNINSFSVIENRFINEDGIQYSSGGVVANITSLVNRIFICLYSMLDFITKIAHEVEALQTDFTSYPKLKSKETVLGYAKKTTFHEMKNTLFERTDTRKMIEFLRNEIIHNASIDSLPKVYQRVEANKIVEKFILLPDFSNGIIETYINRKRFYTVDTKLNEILPDIINDYFTRLSFTLQQINKYCNSDNKA